MPATELSTKCHLATYAKDASWFSNFGVCLSPTSCLPLGLSIMTCPLRDSATSSCTVRTVQAIQLSLYLCVACARRTEIQGVGGIASLPTPGSPPVGPARPTATAHGTMAPHFQERTS
jgi:hypothetical protein